MWIETDMIMFNEISIVALRDSEIVGLVEVVNRMQVEGKWSVGAKLQTGIGSGTMLYSGVATN